ncbi:MAG: redoxin domain-containing protein, partial [Planctomycetaceae bacterium]|nr:redoxin domain-containing protein [Planctomycetaceae bacterium]
MTRRSCGAILVVLAFIASASPTWAGKFNRIISVGDTAPAWRDLPGTDDRPHSLDDFKSAKLTVLIFSCNHCPVMQSYEPLLIAMQKAYAARGVKFVAISCSRFKSDLMPAMKERAAASGLNFPYLHDDSQATGRAYGVGVTPTIFVITPERKIAYLGAVDNGQGKPAQADKHYLRDALDALLDGR